jgi:hypothetical protein
MPTHPPLREEGSAAAAPDWIPDSWRAPDTVIPPAEGLPAAADRWAEWALELHGRLAPGEVALVGLAAEYEFERLTGEEWDEDTIGISVLPAGGAMRGFHSDWWLQAHLGRAFDVSGPSSDEGGRRWIALRRKGDPASAEELRAPDDDEARELTSAQAEVDRLRSHAAQAEARHQRELDALREELGRELMRRAFQATTAEAAEWSNDSLYRLIAAQFEGTVSWRITKPLRRAGQLARRLRRR